ncbi:cytochrome P450 [Roridomyces roridus]|uniref:Cytochrome P450 n=1 Tax=Roridomyces roridus TaxID=1738132 RepID=A0AAD7BZ67_9AGAR|nr:cytochrome P450 [Roridomyces roridus]
MPYIIGLHSAASAFLSAGFATQFTVAIVICLVIVLVTSKPSTSAGSSLSLHRSFFRQRYDFLNWGFQVTGESIFQFKLMNNTVIVLSGSSARQAFFYSKGFDLTEGFKILSGAIPMVRGVTSGLQTKRISTIHRRLAAVQKNAPLSELIPAILEDSRRMMESYGATGTFDPFDKTYELIFQTTVRSLSSSEISDDAVLVARLKMFTTPATVLAPWFPTLSMIKKLWATKEIYDIVVRAIDSREASGIARNDTLQMLMDSGDDKLVIVGFIMGLIVAGARATGTTASWLITFLGGHVDWQLKAKLEMENLLAEHSDSTSASLSCRLAEIPLEAWESSTPIMDSLLRETLRVAQPHTAMRRNLGPDVYINDKLIPSGAYVVYPFSDVHLNPDIYPEPLRFDPSRKPATKVDLGYVGWGVGNTTCLGTRLAKLELKLTTALFLLGFDWHVVDKTGGVPDSLPLPNWNDILMCRPPPGSCNISYNRTELAL